MNPFLAIALVLVALAGLIAAVRFLGIKGGFPPELSRKTVHVGMGLICLTFPWLFQEIWPVLVLAALAVFALLALRIIPVLRSRLGGVLGGVGRDSWGELYFPVAVALVFAMSHGNAVLFCIAVLQLTVADAVGALIGIRFGLHRFKTDDGEKSAEGSTAFFVTACLAAWVPLAFFSSHDPVESVLIAVFLGLVLMLMEAIAWRGLDNLFVPVTCLVLLQKLLPLDVSDLLREIVFLLGVIAAITVWRRRTHLSRSASIGVGLVLYLSWLIGGWPWLLGPLAALTGYSLLCPDANPGGSRHHLVSAVFAVAMPGLCWLYLAQTLQNQTLIYPYGLAYAAHLGMIAAAFFLHQRRAFGLWTGGVLAVLLAFLLPAAPYWFVWRLNPHVVILSLCALILLALATGIFACWQPQIRQCPNDAERWCRQGVLAGAVSLFGAVIINMLEPWTLSIF